MPSHPTRGAWIEMSKSFVQIQSLQGRTPRGVRGLKSMWSRICAPFFKSHPTRGAWIEILRLRKRKAVILVAPHAGCVD